MVTLSYHIRSNGYTGFEPHTRRLLVEAGNTRLTLLLWDKSLAAVDAVEIFTGIGDWEADWQFLLQKSELLQFKQLETTVFYNTLRAVPIPLPFFHAADAAAHLNLLFGEAHGMVSGGDVLPAQDMVVAWQVDAAPVACVRAHFDYYKEACSLSVLPACIPNESGLQGLFAVSENVGGLMLVRDGRILLLQAFSAQEPMDAAWQMLQACHHWGADMAGVQWRAAGLLKLDSPLWQAADNFFEQLAPMHHPAAPKGISPHFLAHFLHYLAAMPS